LRYSVECLRRNENKRKNRKRFCRSELWKVSAGLVSLTITTSLTPGVVSSGGNQVDDFISVKVCKVNG